MKEFSLKPSEVKKVVRYASKKVGEPCELTGYSYSGENEFGFVDVRCEVCTVERPDKPFRRVRDVEICCMMSDRRRSFVTSFLPEVSA